MEAWQRFERWGFITLGALFLGLFIYIAWPRTLEPPIPELGQPFRISHTRGTTQAVYIIREPVSQVLGKIDYRLKNRGFRRPPNSWYGLLTRNNTEWIRTMQGEWKSGPNGQFSVEWNPNVTTIVYSFRRPTWWRAWRRVERDWTNRKREKARQAAMAGQPTPPSVFAIQQP